MSAESVGEPPSGRRVALLVTCLVDLFRPQVGFASARLLEKAGYDVVVPEQGCCGQPNFNSGDREGAAGMARMVIGRFSEFDYVVAPSGSCAAMIRCHYPALFETGSTDRAAAEGLAGKTWELTSFLRDVAGVESVEAEWPGVATYHDGCSGLRELGIRRQPRELLGAVAGFELRELADPEACCGFGGLFCVKYPDVSERIAGAKVQDIADSGAQFLVSGETGCLMHLEGKLHRDGSAVRGLHIAEVLAGCGSNSVKEAPDADDE
jgi:L-lactate dehydrogenase complex protein LldE